MTQQCRTNNDLQTTIKLLKECIVDEMKFNDIIIKYRLVNYMILRRFSLFYNTVVFIDSPDSNIGIIVRYNGLRCKRVRYMKNDKYDYIITICKVPKRQIHIFEKCMRELAHNIMINGHTDYFEFCTKIINDVIGS